MITRSTSAPRTLIIESRYSGGWRRLLIAVIAIALAATILGVEIWAFSWIESRAIERPSSAIFYVYLLVPLVVIVFAPRLLAGSERIELRDTMFIHTRYIARIRTSRNEYDLLRMKGLEVVGTPEQQYDGPVAIRFWYVSGFEYFGGSLEAGERQSVIDKMVTYDRQTREALGVNPDLGLSDTRYWQSAEAREAMLREVYSDQRFLG